MAERSSINLTFVFAIVFIFLAANAFLSIRALNTLNQNNDLVLDTQTILFDLDKLIITITEAESSQRGFLITGEDMYLGPYERAKTLVDATLIATRRNLEGKDVYSEVLPELELRATRRMGFLEKVIGIRRTEGLQAVTNSTLFAEGKREMDLLGAAIEKVELEETRLLAERTEESRISGRNALVTFLLVNFLVLGVAALAFVLNRRHLAHRDQAEATLQAAHDELEERVKQRTQALTEVNVELGRSNRELQDFAFVASHDLQEPLRKIQAFGDRLQTTQADQLGEKGRDYLQRMHSAAGRMHTLINDLLKFSRVTSQAQPFELTDLNEIAANVVSDLEARIAETGGTVEIGDLPSIKADPLQMRQLFQNLIANALKFHRDGVPPHVKVFSEPYQNKRVENRASDLCRISFSDNGIGFHEKYLDRIFTPFQRLHGRNEYEGAGIGLAICRKIVQRHGGTLSAQSKPGEGAVFHADLPLTQT